MGKVKYLMKLISRVDYKNMFKIAGKISKKANKPKIVIIADMVYCGLKYQAGYYDYQEFEFYKLNNKQRATYLTRGKNNEIIKTYNNKEFFPMFNDKYLFNVKFKKFLNRDFLDLRYANEASFNKFISNKDVIIAKPVDGEGGHGIEIYKTSTKNLYKKLKDKNQLLLEEVIKQHKDLDELYDKSVNTLRMFTFYHNGKAYFLQGILKIGNGGVIDNFSSGGMYTFVDDEGTVIAPAIDQADNVFEFHPITKTKIVGYKVPMYKDAIKLVKEASKVVPEVGYVGWDVAISDKGPVIIEGNCFPGVFQIRPSFSKDKLGLLTKYSKIMDIFK